MIKNIKEFEYEKVPAGEGVYISVMISSEKAPHFAMRKFKIQKGGYMPYHTNSVEHEQFVLSGEAKVVIDGEEFRAKKGDVLFIPAGIPHSYESVGEEDYEFLCLVPNLKDEVKIVER